MTDNLRRDDLANVDWSDVSTGETIGPVPPGEVLRFDFMEPLNLSARALARELNVPPNRITEILNDQRAISAETAIHLSRRFGTSAEFWLHLQVAHDLEKARRKVLA